MTDAASAEEAADALEKAHLDNKDAGKVHVAEHLHRSPPALPHSHQDQTGHNATHGSGERKDHHGPGEVKASVNHS
jgi:hypothetical protein